MVVAASTAAQDEDLLFSPQLVDCMADEEAAHGVCDGILINARVRDEGTAFEIVSQVSCAQVVLASH